MKVEVHKEPKNVIKLEITVPVSDLKAVYENILADLVSNSTVTGFRPGKAPKEKVLESLDTGKLNGEVVNKALQTFYPQALKEHHILPAGNPRVEIKQFDLDKDFIFIARVPQKPEIEIGDYATVLKKTLKERKEASRAEKEEKLKKGESIGDVHDHLHPSDVVQALLEVSKLEIAEIMIEEETNRMLSRLLEQAEQVGLSLDQYLQAQGKTAEQLRADYDKISEQTIKAEFILAELVKKSAIEVGDEEVRQAIAASGGADVEEQMKDRMKVWYVKSILEKNNLITQIMEQAEDNQVHKENK
jgi:trigger factor